MIKENNKAKVFQIQKLYQGNSLDNLEDFLFGFTLAQSGISIFNRNIIQVKAKINSLLKEIKSRKITKSNALQIIIDSIVLIKRFNSSQKIDTQQSTKAIKQFISETDQSMKEIISNNKFILLKWEKQQKNQALNAQFLQKFQNQEKNCFQQLCVINCEICANDIEPCDLSPTLQCGHLFHDDCLKIHLKSKIQNGQTTVLCPIEQCRITLKPCEIFQAAETNLWQKYQTYTFNEFVQVNSSDTSWCPTPGCSSVFSFDKQVTEYRCYQCKKHYCLNCKCEYHTNKTCAQYQVTILDKKFDNFVVGAKFKQCPGCKFWVQKNQGCCSILCRCKLRFCYICGGTGCPNGRCTQSGMKKKEVQQ